VHGHGFSGYVYAVVLTAVIVAAALAVGLAFGYVVHGSSTAVSTTATTAQSPTVRAVTARIDPGTVDVDVTLGYETASGAGTGMVITSSGEVVTNNHVIDGATSVRVVDVGNARTYSATVVGYDVSADVAVLQLKGASHLATVPVGGSSVVRVGEDVVAIGNAGGAGGTPSAVSGTVTALDQSITAQSDLTGAAEQLTGLMSTDAPIEPGDSGGPLADTSGHVVGMDTAASTSFTFRGGTTAGFAIPIGSVDGVASQIVHRVSSRAVHIGSTALLGVRVTTTTRTVGAVVVGVEPGTPAATTGLTTGDVIVSIGGLPVRSATTLTDRMLAFRPGASVKLGWTDPLGGSHTATVTLAGGPPA
jgi:S1-C subfamily serine protease